MKKFLLFLTLLVSAIGLTHAAASASINFAEQGYANAKDMTKQSISIGDISASFSKGSNTNNNQPKYYNTSGTSVRMYTGNTLTFSAPTGYFISRIEFTGDKDNSSYGPNNFKIADDPANGTYVAKDLSGTWTCENSKPASVSFKVNKNRVYLQTITVYYEKGTSGGEEPTLTAPNITWTLNKESLADNTLVEATLNGTNTLPTLSFADGAPVTCKSSNEAVATVTDDGKVTIIAAGTTIITASTPADHATFKQASKSYILTVAKQYVFNDTKATLVTDANPLKAGDIIIIANPEKQYVLSNAAVNSGAQYFTALHFDDLNTVLADAMLLQYFEYETDKFALQTLNHAGTSQGFITTSTTTGKGFIDSNVGDVNNVSISIDKNTNEATITFAGSNTIFLNLNVSASPKRFCGYTSSSKQQPVYIYKVETPATIVGDELTEVTISEPTGASSIDAMSIFETNSSADTFVVKMNGVKITSANVTKEVDTSTTLTVNLSGLPYIPGAEFTIAPVVNGEEGHSEVLDIQMPELPLLDFSSQKMALYFDSEAYANEKTCDLDIWVYLTVDMKDPSSPENSLAADDTRRNLTFSFVEFDNSPEGEIYGWYTPYEKVQWCKHGFFTGVDVVDGQPDTSKLNNNQTIELTFNAYFTFNVSAELASLIPAPASAPMAAPARAGEAAVIQTVSQATPLTYSQKLPESLSSIVSGVEGVTVDANAPVEFFNLQGVRVDGDLAPGIYIRRQGQAVSKVRIN